MSTSGTGRAPDSTYTKSNNAGAASAEDIKAPFKAVNVSFSPLPLLHRFPFPAPLRPLYVLYQPFCYHPFPSRSIPSHPMPSNSSIILSSTNHSITHAPYFPRRQIKPRTYALPTLTPMLTHTGCLRRHPQRHQLLRR